MHPGAEWTHNPTSAWNARAPGRRFFGSTGHSATEQIPAHSLVSPITILLHIPLAPEGSGTWAASRGAAVSGSPESSGSRSVSPIMSLPALLRTFSIGRLLFEALTRTGSPSALSKEEGGGYLVEYPDIPGCMSDGETEEEAIANGREAKAIGARQVHAEKRR